jgi:hypothetical protein
MSLFERDFYDDLLHKIGTEEKVALLGSEGVSKSTYLYWYLDKALQATNTGQSFPCLPTNNLPPELIIFQRGENYVRYYFLKKKKVFRGNIIGDLILECLDPKKVVYLYEPLAAKKEPFLAIFYLR